MGKRGEIDKETKEQRSHLDIPEITATTNPTWPVTAAAGDDARVVIYNLDQNYIKNLWLKDLPKDNNAHDTPDLHLALYWLGRELLRRTRAAWYSEAGTGRVRGRHGYRNIV